MVVIKENIQRIKPPRIKSPHKGSIQFDSFFVGGDYIQINRFQLLHEKSHWQVATDPEFKFLLDEYEGSRNLKSWNPNIDYTKYPKTVIYVRVKYGSNSIWSEWSHPHHVTTK